MPTQSNLFLSDICSWEESLALVIQTQKSAEYQWCLKMRALLSKYGCRRGLDLPLGRSTRVREDQVAVVSSRKAGDKWSNTANRSRKRTQSSLPLLATQSLFSGNGTSKPCSSCTNTVYRPEKFFSRQKYRRHKRISNWQKLAVWETSLLND